MLKVNHIGGNQTSRVLERGGGGSAQNGQLSEQAASSNGNRMKASAHKPRIGSAAAATTSLCPTTPTPTTTTTATATTTTTTTTTIRTRSARSSSSPRRPPPPLALTLILLAASLSRPIVLVQANHHARRLPASAPTTTTTPLLVESREPVPTTITTITNTTKTTDAGPGVAAALAPAALAALRPPIIQVQPTSDNDDDEDKLIGLNVRDSLMDLDRRTAQKNLSSPNRDDDDNDDDVFAAAVVGADDDDGDGPANASDGDAEGRPGKAMSPVRRLLIRQLTSLIMNEPPETIAKRIEGNRVRGQMSSFAKDDGPSGGGGGGGGTANVNDHSLANNNENNNNNNNNGNGINIEKGAVQVWAQVKPSYLVADGLETLGGGGNVGDSSTQATASPEELADNYLATSSGQELDDTYGKINIDRGSNTAGQVPVPTADESGSPVSALASEAAAAGDPLVTCPPDYDDLSAAEGSSNLDPEQQQQLLAGADSAGLLLATNRTGGAGEPPQQHRPTPPMQSQCVHPGMRMIEVITKVITPILFTIIIIVGLLGNIIVMMVILEDRQTERELTPTNLLILDLSLADLSFIIFCIPFTGWDYSVGHWVFGSLWCKFNQYLIVVCALSSIYTLVLMSIDRFMAIVYPIECISYRTSKNTLHAIYIKWILILLMASPTIAMHGLIDLPMDPQQYACRFLTDQYDPLSFQITFFVTSYLFPLILIFCLYLSLLNKLWFGTKPHGHKESHKMLESKKKVTWLVAGIVVVFAICWCPIQVMLILMRLKSHKITATYVAVQVFAHTLGYMNSCVNPIVYAFASETFTNSFKRSVFGRFFRICFCSPGAPTDEHSRSNNYNFHNARPSNAAFQNTTTSLNLHNNNNHHNNSANNKNGGNNRALAVHHNHRDNSIVHHHGTDDFVAGGDDSRTCSTKTSQVTSSCQSSSENNSNGKHQVMLPLEPRDRVVVSPAPGAGSISDNARIRNDREGPSSTVSAATAATAGRGDDEQRQIDQSRGDKVLIPREATITREDIDLRAKTGLPAKQQLVARVVQTGNNQASQRCETACYQQEPIGP